MSSGLIRAVRLSGLTCAALIAFGAARPLAVSAQTLVPVNDIQLPAWRSSDWKTNRQAAFDETIEPTRLPQSASSQPRQEPNVLLVSNESQLIQLPQMPALDGVQLEGDGGLVTLVTTGADLNGVLRMIADQHRLNLVVGPDVGGTVNVSIHNAELGEVLDAILGVAGFRWSQSGNLLYVTGSSSPTMDPRTQGRTVQVYPLSYVASDDVQLVATGLLSSVGSAFVTKSDAKDQMRTREILVVDDIASAQARIAQYVAQVDVAPRQVLIESHVLQVALSNEDRHGVNLRNLARLNGSRITLEGSGFAEDQTGPSMALRVEGNDMGALIELLQSHTNSRTLASPKLSVINHQEARIQIGQRLPYTVATTTQTTTVQSVEFLEVGIVLTVTPIITEDGNVLMTVLPKVSGGKITENGFPEEETTEVSTTVLMPDGGGLVIGGLIREDNVHSHSFTPLLNRIPLVGRLFQRHSDTSRRNELIVALVTHVMPDVCSVRNKESEDLYSVLPEYALESLRSPIPKEVVIGDELIEID